MTAHCPGRCAVIGYNLKQNANTGLVRPPVYGSNGRTYKMLVMFFSFFFLFRHAFSEVPRPIALKLGLMVGNCLD